MSPALKFYKSSRVRDHRRTITAANTLASWKRPLQGYKPDIKPYKVALTSAHEC